MKRITLFITALFLNFSILASDVDMEVIEIIGSKEDATKIAGSASVITEEELETYEYTDIHKIYQMFLV